MSRFNHYNHITTRGYVLRTLTIIVSLVILVSLMPRGNQKQFVFEKNRPWNYGTFIAKENFFILKPDSVLEREHDSLLRLYKPIYILDNAVAEQQTQLFLKAFDNELRSAIPAQYRSRIAARLQEVYEQGILSTDDYDQVKKSPSHAITVTGMSEERMAESRPIEKLFTPMQAYEWLVADPDSAIFQRSVLQHCNLSRFLVANLTYDEVRSQLLLDDTEKKLVMYAGEVVAGQKIIDFGDIVDDNTYNILRSWQADRENHERSASERFSQLGGQIVYTAIILICLLVFFNQFRSDYLQRARTVMLICILVMLFPLITYAIVRFTTLSVYLIPYCILPIFIRVFLDSRTAFTTHLISVLLSAIAVTTPFEFVVVQLIAGLVAIYSLRELSQRSELFRAVVQVVLVSLLVHLCFELVRMSVVRDAEYDFRTYLFIVVNGTLLLISYLLLIPVERIFKFTSMVTLVELSNTNNEVLRELSEKAPGTFQHSMQVANLAAEVALRLGAKSQLVRTAALYHDIGKLYDPGYYTENQSGYNPHDQLSYTKSAKIIIRHVPEGLRLAEKYQLPDVIRQFIATHHGTSKTKYFYVKYKSENPLFEVDESCFTYPGPNPSTIEQAILMMCDAVEAASRSLPEYTEESVRELVNRIIDSQVAEGYFNECPITFQDISETKRVLFEKLMSIYHTRISYPTES